MCLNNIDVASLQLDGCVHLLTAPYMIDACDTYMYAQHPALQQCNLQRHAHMLIATTSVDLQEAFAASRISMLGCEFDCTC